MKDVQPTDVKYRAINWAVDQGVMNVYNGQFFPRSVITELQLLQMIAELDDNYPYSKTPDMLYNYYGGELNVPLMGMKKKVARQDAITRGQFAIYYAALTGLDLSEKQAIQNVYRLEMSLGVTGKRTYADFMADRVLNREDIATFFYRMKQERLDDFKGIEEPATGKDNAKITLPLDFESTSGTVTTPGGTGGNVNDSSNHWSTFKPVQSVHVERNELIANGVDATRITIQLKDGYGNPIPQNESLQFRVTSTTGATFSMTGNSQSRKVNVIQSDGGELSFFVTAPTLTKSVLDTISVQMINNDAVKYAAFKNQKINVNVRYVPMAELRISYEVFDPDQLDWSGGNVDEGVKPLAPMPTAETPDSPPELVTLTPDNGKINITDIDPDYHTFSGTKVETYLYAGQQRTGEVNVIDAMYENADLRFNGYAITLWLFEQIITERFHEGYNPEVQFSISQVGNPTYSIPSTIAPNFDEYNEMTDAMATVKFLVDEYIPERTNQIFLYHYDSVMAIKAIYDTYLSDKDKNDMLLYYGQTISKLNAAVTAVESLRAKEELAQRPSDMDRYTKVIVSLVAPGGQIITDFKGQVEIEYNGKKMLANFTTNTTTYYPETGHAGAAVVHFNDLIYGHSKVKATLKPSGMDDRYAEVLKNIVNVPKEQTIFTNFKFEKNACSKEVEVAYVIDQSASMRKHDPRNYIAQKTAQMMRQMPSENTGAIKFTTDAHIAAKGKSADILKMKNLFGFENQEDDATDLAKGLDVALGNFSHLQSTKKAIVLVSDGNTTPNQIQSMITKAKQQNVSIYTVALGGTNEANLTLMKQLASETGGTYYHVTDVENIHGSYQAIINSILCQGAAQDLSCNNVATLLNNATVEITRSTVTMTGVVQPNCKAAKVEARFIADHGDMTFELTDRGQNVYKLSKAIRVFENFELYNEVEFIAYDAAGKIIGTKQIRVQ